ncbi:MAG: L-ribulose-5-phosphate 4-epimerase [Eubacteriales bacterium]|nr:L-ribulose-5-phosphate 4-epimerase [Eubacteriales bacterium]
MHLEELKEQAYRANMDLVKYGLVIFTWGNVSQLDAKEGVFAIKPSGVEYDKLTPEDMVVMDLTGKVVSGTLNPSSDTDTHLVLYQRFPEIGGVVHTHSTWATVWAQACMNIPCYGTTHADTFYGAIPCTRPLTPAEIQGEYETSTGHVIAEAFAARSPMQIPGVLVANHGPFAWGKDGADAVHNAVIIEQVAKMAYSTRLLNPGIHPVSQPLLNKHYLRKHGKDAYYGQKQPQ